MTHKNAPLSVEGRRRLIRRCHDRPIAHVAAEMGISRACASNWVNRYRLYGDLGLLDRSSTPHRQPTATPPDVIAKIEDLRRTRKWSAARITFEINGEGTEISRRTVTRHLRHLGLHRRRFIDPTYLDSAVDGHSRLAYTEALPDEKAITAIGFMHRARVWLAAHGITRIERIVTDNESCYRANVFARAMLEHATRGSPRTCRDTTEK